MLAHSPLILIILSLKVRCTTIPTKFRSEIAGDFIVADDMPSLNGLDDDDVMPLEERFRKVSAKSEFQEFSQISQPTLSLPHRRVFGFQEPRQKFKRIDSSMCLVVPNNFRMKNNKDS